MFSGESFGLEFLGWMTTVFIFAVGILNLAGREHHQQTIADAVPCRLRNHPHPRSTTAGVVARLVNGLEGLPRTVILLVDPQHNAVLGVDNDQVTRFHITSLQLFIMLFIA